MFELHDALSYLMSIGVIFSFAYLYLNLLPTAGTDNWTAVSAGSLSLPRLSKPSVAVHYTDIYRLTRQIKRKEAPDDDSSPCSSLLNEHIQVQDQQGGRWKPWIHTKNTITTKNFKIQLRESPIDRLSF